MCDINPDKIHLVLPVFYRPRRKGGDQYVLHYEDLKENDFSWHEGIRIVAPAVAIRQAVCASVPSHLIRQAIDKARRLGLAPKQDLNSLTTRLEERL